MSSYAITVTTQLGQDEAVAAVREALAEQGFGVLTEIDVAATIKAKLDKDVPPQVILGACRPPLAHAAIEADPTIGVLLPCNVVVRQGADGTVIEAMDPQILVGLDGTDAFIEVAADARTRISAALGAVARG